jgi:predicted RNA-binding Zn-ribbon protein involved in translation (DUF1610 family)
MRIWATSRDLKPVLRQLCQNQVDSIIRQHFASRIRNDDMENIRCATCGTSILAEQYARYSKLCPQCYQIGRKKVSLVFSVLSFFWVVFALLLFSIGFSMLSINQTTAFQNILSGISYLLAFQAWLYIGLLVRDTELIQRKGDRKLLLRKLIPFFPTFVIMLVITWINSILILG